MMAEFWQGLWGEILAGSSPPRWRYGAIINNYEIELNFLVEYGAIALTGIFHNAKCI